MRTHPGFRGRSGMLLSLMMLAAGGAAATGTPQAEWPAFKPGDDVTESGGASFAGVDELLTALEEAGRSLDRLSAAVYYERMNDLVGEVQIRRGRLAYDRRVGIGAPPPPEMGGDPAARPERRDLKRFNITFDSLQVEDVINTEYRRAYVFDGEWLAEIEPADKQFTRRQVVPPGEVFDPLRIGEGPFPVPLGQRKADILERFDAELVTPAAGLGDGGLDGQMRALARAKAVQLRLVPRPGTDEADEYREVRIWYDRASEHLLPVMARTSAVDGDISTVLLTDFEVNGAAFEERVFETRLPPGDDWNVHVVPYRGR